MWKNATNAYDTKIHQVDMYVNIIICSNKLLSFVWSMLIKEKKKQKKKRRRNCHQHSESCTLSNVNSGTKLSIMSISTSAFQSVCVCFYYSIYFFRDCGSSFISWTSINSWFLKFSLTQTNRTCKAFHFTWLCMI